MHTPITFDVKGYDKEGKVVDGTSYHTPKLNAFNGHWCVVGRMMNTIQKNKKVKSVRVFMDGLEYVYNETEYEWVKV